MYNNRAKTGRASKQKCSTFLKTLYCINYKNTPWLSLQCLALIMKGKRDFCIFVFLFNAFVKLKIQLSTLNDNKVGHMCMLYFETKALEEF